MNEAVIAEMYNLTPVATIIFQYTPYQIWI